MQSFVKINNDIFNYNLTPKALFVYSYLCFRSNLSMYAKVKLNTMAESCNINIKTVSTAIQELEQKNLIVKSHCYKNQRYITSSYKIVKITDSHWFKLDTYIFKTNIKPTDFMVYCYIISKMSDSSQEAFPSLSAISQGTCISKGRVSQAIKYLRQYTYLNRVKRHYKRTGAFRHNKYTHFYCNLSLQNKVMCLPKGKFYSLFFPLSRGSPQITKPLLYPHLITNKRLRTIIYNLN